MTGAIRERIAVDVDDVLADSTDALRLYINQREGIDLTPQQYNVEGKYWGYYDKIWEQHGINSEGLLQEFHGGMVTSQADIRPITGAPEGCRRLNTAFDLSPVSSRPVEMESETKIWLAEQIGPVVDLPTLIGFAPGASRTKGEVCVELGAKYLIDDNIQHCISAVSKGITAILFGNYGWHDEIPADLPQCKNWEEVCRYFNV